MAQYVDVKTAHGPVKFAYWLDVPGGGTTVNRALPVILFIHTIFSPSLCFREQFADPSLRRFNLLAIDMLDYGWTEGDVPQTYTQEDAAEDVSLFLAALDLPPVFICALSSGTITSFQLAVSYPKQVAGLFMISPLGLEETEHAGSARKEINDVWKIAFADPTGVIDQEALEHAISGVFQLSLTGQIKPIAIAIALATRTVCVQRWSHAKQRECELRTCTFEVMRHGYSTEELTALRNIPTAFMLGTVDFAYPLDYYRRFEAQLRDANVPLESHVIDGAPHCAQVSHQEDVARLMSDFVLRHWAGGDNVIPAMAAPPGTDIPTVFDDTLQLKAVFAQLAAADESD